MVATTHGIAFGDGVQLLLVLSHANTCLSVGGIVTVSTSAKSENSRIESLAVKTPLGSIVATLSDRSGDPPFPRTASEIDITSPTKFPSPSLLGVTEVIFPEESIITSNVPAVPLADELPATPVYVAGCLPSIVATCIVKSAAPPPPKSASAIVIISPTE